jgi:hypothetical protein
MMEFYINKKQLVKFYNGELVPFYGCAISGSNASYIKFKMDISELKFENDGDSTTVKLFNFS